MSLLSPRNPPGGYRTPPSSSLRRSVPTKACASARQPRPAAPAVHFQEPSKGNYVVRTLRAYANIAVPSVTETKNFDLGSEPSCEVTIPVSVPLQMEMTWPSDERFQSGSDMQLISQWAVPCLFRVLSLQDIFSFYTAALLEKNILIISDNPGILSGIMLVSFLPLFLLD